MLLNHTSGIPGTRYTGAETTVALPGYAQAVVASLADQRLKSDPGDFAVYCNDGFTLVDPLVAAVAGMSYVDWVKQKIFARLGMKNSMFSLTPLQDGSYAKAYRSGVAMPQEYINVDAAGGIYSTPADMAAFARMFLNEGMAGDVQVLSKESVQKMAVDQTVGTFNPVPCKSMAYELGWDTVIEPKLGQAGVKGWTKNGGTFFYGSQILVAPEEWLAAVALGPIGSGYSPLAILQRLVMRALSETGRVSSFPTPLPPRAEPVATAPAGLLTSVEGIYAKHDYVYQLKAEPDGSLTLLTLDGAGFSPSIIGLRYRSDGWFTSDALPLMSFRVVSGGANQYLSLRSQGADKSYLDSQAFAQKLTVRGSGLANAWSGRLGKKWLVVNEPPESLAFLAGQNPLFGIMTLPELPGVIFAVPSLPPMGTAWQTQALDGSMSDQTSGMMLLIPGMGATDMNHLDVVIYSEEEWLRWGGYLNRPLETMMELPAAADSSVAIGPEGYAEWRSVRRGTAQISISISGVRSWRLYDDRFQTLKSGGESDQLVLPPGTGLAYLMLYADAGITIKVTVP